MLWWRWWWICDESGVVIWVESWEFFSSAVIFAWYSCTNLTPSCKAETHNQSELKRILKAVLKIVPRAFVVGQFLFPRLLVASFCHLSKFQTRNFMILVMVWSFLAAAFSFYCFFFLFRIPERLQVNSE